MKLPRTMFSGCLLLLAPQIALAHSPIKGMGDFLNGILHPFFVPAQILLILALGLWYGQHQPNQHKRAILFFLASLIAGLVASIYAAGFYEKTIALLLLLAALLLSLLIIVNMSLTKHAALFSIAGIIAGFILGLDSARLELQQKAMLVSLFGSGVGIYFLLLYAMALSESLANKHWQNIAVRILASWISASVLMVLALMFSAKN